MSCGNTPIIFGQPVLSGVTWPIPLAYADLSFSGILGTDTDMVDANGNQIVDPYDLTGAKLDCFIIDPDTGLQVVQWSSTGLDPVFTLVDVAVYPNPNYTIFVTNTTLNDLFDAKAYDFTWVLTDSNNIPQILFEGQVVFS